MNDVVLVEERQAESYDKYKGYTHIVVPNAFQHGPEDRAVVGTVVAKGPHCREALIPLGSTVVLGKWDGARFPHEGRKYVMVKEDQVMAVLDGA